MPVAVPTGDPSFDPLGTGTQTIPLTRSIYDSATGTSVANPRQQINVITAFIDGSQIYGSDADRAAALRTFSGGSSKPATAICCRSTPWGFTNDNALGSAGRFAVRGRRHAGQRKHRADGDAHVVHARAQSAGRQVCRAEPQPGPTSRSINRPGGSSIAEMQSITYNEFLPALLGQGALPSYHGYNPQVNPGIANEFSTAAFRLGHSLLGNDVEFLDNLGNPVHDEVELRDTFFNPALLEQTGIDPHPQVPGLGRGAGRSITTSLTTCAISSSDPGIGRPRPGVAQHPARPRSWPGRLQHGAGRLRTCPRSRASPRSRPTFLRSRPCKPPTETSTTSISGSAPWPRITFAARASGRCCPRSWSINSRDCAMATDSGISVT